MKALITILIVLVSQSALAINASSVNVNLGAGMFGSRGIYGLSVERFFTPNHTVSLSGGVDLIGMTGSIGYKYFTDKANNSKTFWDKCLFLFECSSHYYFGPSLQLTNATRTQITSDGSTRSYDTDPKYLGMLAVGVRDVLSSGFTLDFEVSYRSLMAGGASDLASGVALANDQNILNVGNNTFGFGIALGYLW